MASAAPRRCIPLCAFALHVAETRPSELRGAVIAALHITLPLMLRALRPLLELRTLVRQSARLGKAPPLGDSWR
jgi:ABC-type molybdate transport system permease subunit